MTGENRRNVNGRARELSREEGYEQLNRLAQRTLGITGEEFIRRWQAGEYDSRSEDPEIVRLAMLIPIAA